MGFQAGATRPRSANAFEFVGVYVYVYMPIGACGGQGWIAVPSSGCFSFFGEAGSLTEPVAHLQGCIGWPPSPTVSHVSSFPSGWGHRHSLPQWTFYVSAGDLNSDPHICREPNSPPVFSAVKPWMAYSDWAYCCLLHSSPAFPDAFLLLAV